MESFRHEFVCSSGSPAGQIPRDTQPSLSTTRSDDAHNQITYFIAVTTIKGRYAGYVDGFGGSLGGQFPREHPGDVGNSGEYESFCS